MNLEAKVKELGLTLPAAPEPVGSYRPLIESRGMAYLSGQVSKTAEGVIIAGKLGEKLSLEEGQKAAQAAALNVLSILKETVGFDRIEKLLRITGYVQVSPGFFDIHKVMNGASDFFLEVLGESGIHARSAVGVAGLPLDAAVEIETTFQLKD